MSYNQFGMWDAMALWYMMDHIHDSQYRNMYYNQQNNPDMIKWRKEADRLAKDNTELKSKLETMDNEVAQLKGTPRDEKYVPKELGGIALTPEDSHGWVYYTLLSIMCIIFVGFLSLICYVLYMKHKRVKQSRERWYN
jgi:hypothetical protein